MQLSHWKIKANGSIDYETFMQQRIVRRCWCGFFVNTVALPFLRNISSDFNWHQMRFSLLVSLSVRLYLNLILLMLRQLPPSINDIKKKYQQTKSISGVAMVKGSNEYCMNHFLLLLGVITERPSPNPRILSS